MEGEVVSNIISVFEGGFVIRIFSLGVWWRFCKGDDY